MDSSASVPTSGTPSAGRTTSELVAVGVECGRGLVEGELRNHDLELAASVGRCELSFLRPRVGHRIASVLLDASRVHRKILFFHSSWCGMVRLNKLRRHSIRDELHLRFYW